MADVAAPCMFLEWDTAFWGVRTARVQGNLLTPEYLDAIDAWCGKQEIACLYFLARSDDMRTARLAEDHRFRFVDVRIILRRSLEITVPETAQDMITVRPSQWNDCAALETIARMSYRDTRFYYDGHFAPERVDALYATWITKSVADDSEQVLVADDEDTPIGYITCQCNRDAQTGTIGLVGVSADTRGKGVGQALLNRALHWFAEQGMKRVTVATQGRNVGAQRLYQRGGFVTDTVHLWYHKWYGDGEVPG